MLINPTIDELDAKYDSRYEIVMLAAKRARDIKAGAPALTEHAERNPLTQAAVEMKQGIIESKKE